MPKGKKPNAMVERVSAEAPKREEPDDDNDTE